MRFLYYYIVSCAGVLYTFTIGVFKRSNREWIYAIAERFGKSTKTKSTLRKVSITELIAASEAILLTETEGVDGNISLQELTIIAKLVRWAQPKRIFEIGTFDGRTTLNMAINAPADAEVFTLDLTAAERTNTTHSLAPFEERYVNKAISGDRFRNNPGGKNIQQLIGDSASFDYTSYAESIDLVFIDGSHAYEYVKSDTEVSLKLLRPQGGIVIWHDCGVWNDVTRYLHEMDAKLGIGTLKQIEGTSLVIWDLRKIR